MGPVRQRMAMRKLQRAAEKQGRQFDLGPGTGGGIMDLIKSSKDMGRGGAPIGSPGPNIRPMPMPAPDASPGGPGGGMRPTGKPIGPGIPSAGTGGGLGPNPNNMTAPTPAPMGPGGVMKKGGKVKSYKSGGSTASKRADGIAQRGKTRGKFV